jgi:hypothetical protein
VPTVDRADPTPSLREQVGSSWVQRALPWAGWCVLFVPLSIVAHELGHLSAAFWFGLPDPAIHYSSISHGDVAAQPRSAVGVVGLMGPAVTVILALIACGWIILRGPARWAFALAIAAVSRFVVGVPYTVVNIVIRLTGRQLRPPAFDEHKAGTALGWSGDALLASTAVVLVVVVFVIGSKLPRGQRLTAWTGLLLGTALGWLVWMKVLGPVLLP